MATTKVRNVVCCLPRLQLPRGRRGEKRLLSVRPGCKRGRVGGRKIASPKTRGERVSPGVRTGALAASTVVIWKDWSAVAFAGVVGMVLERKGGSFMKTLSAPLLATLIGLAFTNLGLTTPGSSVVTVVNRYLLVLAVPMLLMNANMKKVLSESRRLGGAFCLGAIATCVSTIVTFYFIPLANLGAQESWKVASALASRHIGGAVNFIAVSQSLNISSDVVAAALAADNLICALYFMAIFYIARNIGPEKEKVEEEKDSPVDEDGDMNISVYNAGLALGFSSVVCYLSSLVANNVVQRGGTLIPIATLITVFVATVAPRLLEPIASAGEGLALLIMQFFFACVGMSGSIQKVLALAPLLFLFSFFQVFIHLLLIFLVGKSKLFRFSTKEILLASNANVGGPTVSAYRFSKTPTNVRGANTLFVSCLFSDCGCHVCGKEVEILLHPKHAKWNSRVLHCYIHLHLHGSRRSQAACYAVN